jgi:hypothetical protein
MAYSYRERHPSMKLRHLIHLTFLIFSNIFLHIILHTKPGCELFQFLVCAHYACVLINRRIMNFLQYL